MVRQCADAVTVSEIINGYTTHTHAHKIRKISQINKAYENKEFGEMMNLKWSDVLLHNFFMTDLTQKVYVI